MAYAKFIREVYGSPICDLCDTGLPEDLAHVLLLCPTFQQARTELIRGICAEIASFPHHSHSQLVFDDPLRTMQQLLAGLRGDRSMA